MTDATPRAGGTRRRSGPPRWLVPLGTLVLRLLARTWRYRVIGAEGVRSARRDARPMVFAFWHGRMLPLLWYHRNEGIVILVSEHGDGEIIARVAARLGYRSVRGSTTRGGGRALLGLIRAAREGCDVGVTPDGPRGPAEVFAPGAVVVAQRSGASMLLLAAGATRAWRLGSWDGFLIPKPFARVTIRYDVPTPVPRGDVRDAAKVAAQLQARLRELAAECDD
ncbi:MAG TPA: lysophospholipid acyltransferase family protein [Gemmatimonadaceae bacterium]|nr:lysophospholipid acyltransferase family protein [Gemmatimonadaceae bacterium]